jgi:hypothetical protein
VATAVVAALVVVAGVFVARRVLDIPVLAPRTAGDLGSSVTAVYAGVAAACALLATGLLHVLLLSTPRPLVFFAWITALADLIAVAAPFSQPAALPSKVFTAVVGGQHQAEPVLLVPRVVQVLAQIGLGQLPADPVIVGHQPPVVPDRGGQFAQHPGQPLPLLRLAQRAVVLAQPREVGHRPGQPADGDGGMLQGLQPVPQAGPLRGQPQAERAQLRALLGLAHGLVDPPDLARQRAGLVQPPARRRQG